MNDDAIQEVLDYNELLDHLNNSEEDDIVEWKFKAITAHEGPLHQHHPNYNVSP